MEKSPQLLVYKASAGSGKTFTLSVEYIKHLIADPKAYRNILAVTFTNKATTEMKERILNQLYGIWIKDRGSDAYLKKIAADLQMEEDAVRTAAGKALHTIIHDYSRFRVETIDSFFQSVMRNLARELELGANMDIELSVGAVLNDAVDAMIEKLDRHSLVLYWLLEYIDERIANDKRWDVSKEIKRFGRNIFDEEYVAKGEKLRAKLKDKQAVTAYSKELKAIRDEALEQMKGFAEQFEGVLEVNGLAPTDLIRGANGISSYFRKLAAGKTGDDLRNKTVEDCLESPEKWTSKSSPNRDVICALAASELMPLLQTSEKFRPKNNRIINSCELILNHINNLRLLTNIDEEVRIQNQEHNRFLLSDTNALLHSLIREGDPSFVFEKIGSSIRTVMIDEFQDTSRMQWENFRLLLLEGLSQGADSLIVGDVKQSIYRWRSGDWQILNGLKGRIEAFPVNIQSLSTNYRSESNVIAFNNTFFTTACKVLSDWHVEETGVPCQELEDAYRDVCQESAKKTEKGFVQVNFVKEEAEETYTEATIRLLAGKVDELIASGVRMNDIAILVRKNKNIPPIADYFDKHTPYTIVSDEAFQLSASLAVSVMIDGLRYLANPDDRIAQARLAVNFQQEVMQRPVDTNTVLLNNMNDYLPASFLLQQEALRMMPLYELLEKLFGIFELHRLEKQDAYLCAFFDAVTEYMQKHASELTSFLTYWDEKLALKTIPSGEIEGIRILSIHKSKGLEYHTVLLPFCDWTLETERGIPHLVWCSPEDEPFNELDILPVNYSKAMQASVFQKEFREEQLQLWVDNLNLLYVAFTRACKNLIIWSTPQASRTVAELLLKSLGCISGLSEEELTETPYECGELCLSEEKTAQAQGNRLNAAPQPITLHMESLEPDIEFRQSNRSADFIQDDEEDKSAEYIRQGELLHRLFSSIRIASDLPGAIEELMWEGILESEEKAEQIGKLAEWALRNPQVKGWYEEGWELYNECSILYHENSVMQTRRPDRVMIKDGKVVVVDFKFGKKKDVYRKQVEEYMQLLGAMGYTDIKGYLWYVFANELDEVTTND